MKYKESNNVELKELLTVDNNFEKEVVAFLIIHKMELFILE